MLKDKNIILGVTGGIAAYKCVDLVSRLRKQGADVHVILTKGAQNFVTETAMREISGNPVVTSMWQEIQQYDVEHIALARLADVVLVAPATANVIAKCACGMADDMLTTTLLATKAPVFFAPAMNTNMYENSITQQNLHTLQERGCHIIDPAAGYLACGTSGVGRMPEPQELVKILADFFATGKELAEPDEAASRQQGLDFSGLNILVTAAGTREPIDPVRYIGNRSSGKMGYAIAEAARDLGANVTLISGPSALTPLAGVNFFKVESARDMRRLVLENFPESQIVIKAAAVADYRVKNVADHKIKKNDEELTLVLEKNPDILKELGQKKQKGQVLVGFAAETQNIENNALAKMERKNLDFIAANDVGARDRGFAGDNNAVTLYRRDGQKRQSGLVSKAELADWLLDELSAAMEAK